MKNANSSRESRAGCTQLMFRRGPYLCKVCNMCRGLSARTALPMNSRNVCILPVQVQHKELSICGNFKIRCTHGRHRCISCLFCFQSFERNCSTEPINRLICSIYSWSYWLIRLNRTPELLHSIPVAKVSAWYWETLLRMRGRAYWYMCWVSEWCDSRSLREFLEALL